MELQRLQDVILTEIGTEICEEDEEVEMLFAAEINSTDYFLDFRNRDVSGFILEYEVRTDVTFKVMFSISNELFNRLRIDFIVYRPDV